MIPTPEQIKRIEELFGMKYQELNIFTKDIDEETEYVLYAGFMSSLYIENKKTRRSELVKLTRRQEIGLDRIWGVFV